jgi:broad specificity phosphatase PhoE
MAERLVVIRSGATDYEMQGRIRGTLEVPLCEQGIKEAEQVACQLACDLPEVLATSGDSAARETARIIGRRLGLEPKLLAGLANLDLGLWQGSRADEIRCRQPRLHRQWQGNPWTVTPPEGETLDTACRRVETVVERFLRRTVCRTVALVLPDPLDRVVRWMGMGKPVGDLWRRASNEPGVQLIPLAGQWRTVVGQPGQVASVG